ncbi:MAG TPA: hypothetical protein QF604_17495 [Candidatus Latescibacteria bacterium]|mgnify:FL=1|jgi:hypothetical protein|nr:hypothetical protein [Gemmatimonadota bacterium]MDP7363589.1 hypothetical protein [Candidatus Latescibacterota bacterium]HCV22855.1 hypothetical protein [Candidatus Latescibacterota bacterium]HJN29700.1 hypothetical protein [Candidatus Latescibacterota bacterium]
MHPDPALTTLDVQHALQASGLPLQEWGKALDGTPMMAARTGGQCQPAIFLTAGAHCTETAGVHACLELMGSLETQHEVQVLPLRDPMGFAGVSHCLSVAAGEDITISDPQESLEVLRERGTLLWSEGDLYLYQLGGIGFVWGPPTPGLETFWRQFALTGRLPQEASEILVSLLGRSIFFLNVNSTIDGSGSLQRCYHTVLGTDGQWLHLNRFFGQPHAPGEVAAVDHLIQRIRPGLTVDLHEGNGEGFWMPIPRPVTGQDRVFEMTRAFFSYIEEKGYPIETYEHWKASNGIEADPDWMVPEPDLTGLFWLQQEKRQEGPNLMTYAAGVGIGYGTEGPMEQPLAMRVDGLTEGIRRAIQCWELTQ